MADIKKAAILVIGDEILNGKVQDTNSHVLSRCLFEIGISLVRIEVIPDNVNEIAVTLRRLSALVDYVFTSGGIGPTHDDVTYEAVAKAFGQQLEYHTPTLTKLSAFYEQRQQRVNDAAKRMTLFPSQSRVIELPKLWVPLVVCENVYILPGVPQIFSAMVQHLPSILGVHGKIYRRLLYTPLTEVEIAEDLKKADVQFASVSIGSYPRFNDQKCPVMVSIEGRSEAEVEDCTKLLTTKLPAFNSVQECHDNYDRNKANAKL